MEINRDGGTPGCFSTAMFERFAFVVSGVLVTAWLWPKRLG